MPETIQDAKFYIDPEIEELLPKATEKQYEDLKQQIIRDGRFIETIKCFNNCVIDGHKRCQIWQELPEDTPIKPPRVEHLAFNSWTQAKAWALSHQLTRRNLDRHQRDIAEGRLYELLKSDREENLKPDDGDEKSETPIESPPKGNSRPSEDEDTDNTTAQRVSEETRSSPRTVKANAAYVRAIDAIKSVNQTDGSKIESGDWKLNKKTVLEIGKLTKPDIRQALKNLKWGNDLYDGIDLPESPPNKKKKSKKKTPKPKRFDWKKFDKLMGPLVRYIDEAAKHAGKQNGREHKDATTACNDVIAAFKKLKGAA